MILTSLLIILLITGSIIITATGTTTKRIRKTLPAPNRTALLENYEVSNEENDLNKNITKNIKNAYDRNKIRGYRGWTHAPEKIKEWNKWLDDYYEEKNSKTNIDYVDPVNIHEFDWERGPHSGFPLDWADLGKGQQGVAPPPWAYEPISNAKPRCCYLSLNVGEVCEDNSTTSNTAAKITTNTNSTSVQERYAYNPILNKCEEFHYEGCKGNKNNFKDKIKCEATCINPTTSTGGCDHNSHIRIEIKEYK